MQFMMFSALVSSWLVCTPMLWAHQPAKAALAAAVGLVAMFLSPLGVWWTPARRIVAASGAVLALSNFVFFDGMATLVNDSVVGVSLLLAGFSPKIKVIAAHGRDVPGTTTYAA